MGASFASGRLWRPTPRTTAEWNWEHRFFGTARLARLDRRGEAFEQADIARPAEFDAISALGEALISPTAFVLPFEVASVLLVAALVGALARQNQEPDSAAVTCIPVMFSIRAQHTRRMK